IALSNVVGSNIFNLLVVLGVCAVIHAVPVDRVIIRRDFPISILIAVLVFAVTGVPSIVSGKLPALTMSDNAGMVYRALGLTLLVLFASYICYLIYDAKKHPTEEEEIKTMPLWKCALLIIVGIALIIAGGQAVVKSAVYIAQTFGMTETLIGLTVVALGTSLPELVTSIVAARKGEVEMAVGNVVGSNIFNILFILGVSSSIHPVAVNTASVYDMMILIAVSVMTWIFAIRGKSIGRLGGAVMLLCYIAATTFAIVR
ncbi:MAG: sodium:calcium antiporter, partial [Spirochaetaceae bacterium]|nr:sodium:calcium antiporter [Spirochaetaceae bacterium]